jgi:hypothetical protein
MFCPKLVPEDAGANTAYEKQIGAEGCTARALFRATSVMANRSRPRMTPHDCGPVEGFSWRPGADVIAKADADIYCS